MISRTIEEFDWNKEFSGKNIDEKASILLQTILNIMSNFIPNEITTIDDRNPPWINRKIKYLIRNKTEYFKNFFNPNNAASIRQFQLMQESLQRNNEISKERYYSKLSARLTKNKINPKCY